MQATLVLFEAPTLSCLGRIWLTRQEMREPFIQNVRICGDWEIKGGFPNAEALAKANFGRSALFSNAVSKGSQAINGHNFVPGRS